MRSATAFAIACALALTACGRDDDDEKAATTAAPAAGAVTTTGEDAAAIDREILESDQEAKRTVRAASSAVISCVEDGDGENYEECAEAAGDLSFAADGDSFRVKVTAEKSQITYRIIRNGENEKKLCSTPGVGGCGADGTW